jgi:diphthamide biosynthesis enzyme Dph1/Dph2-like protein
MFALELDKVVSEIKKRDAKHVLIQLPDGLKIRAKEVVDTIEEKTGAKVSIWMGGCFGACDLPVGVDDMGIDFLVAFGHNIFHKTYW